MWQCLSVSVFFSRLSSGRLNPGDEVGRFILVGYVAELGSCRAVLLERGECGEGIGDVELRIGR